MFYRIEAAKRRVNERPPFGGHVLPAERVVQFVRGLFAPATVRCVNQQEVVVVLFGGQAERDDTLARLESKPVFA